MVWKSPNHAGAWCLHKTHFATMAAAPTKTCNQDDATGFIRLNGLSLKVAAKVHGKK